MTSIRPHIVGGKFQSDKYPSCPPGKVPLSVEDPTAQDLLWAYAQRRRPVDADFASDLEYALVTAGYAQPPKALPVIKYVGGKSRLLPELVRRAPARFGNYYEPFCGGAALFFRIAPEYAVLADQNADLVNLYGVVAKDVEPLITRLAVLEKQHGKRHYYKMRERWNAMRGPYPRSHRTTEVDLAAMFVYLNRTGYNGMWRVNRAGDFNVPMGQYKRPKICDPDGLRVASRALAGATIVACDYRVATRYADRGSFVYMDPPYDPLTETASFTGYSAAGFSSEDQRELAEHARGLVKRGCYVMLSNSNTRFVRSLYKGFRIDRVKCPRAINSDTSKRASITELVITGGY